MSIALAYSVVRATEVTGLSKSHLERAIRAGQLKAKKSGKDKKGEPVGKYVILARDLEAYLEGLVDA